MENDPQQELSLLERGDQFYRNDNEISIGSSIFCKNIQTGETTPLEITYMKRNSSRHSHKQPDETNRDGAIML